MTFWYGLDGRPIDMAAGAALIGDVDRRRVALSTLATARGPVEISTVFLSLDHSFGAGGNPVLWETLAFDTPGDDELGRRYRSLGEAVEGHVALVGVCRRLLAAEGVPVAAEDHEVGAAAGDRGGGLLTVLQASSG